MEAEERVRQATQDFCDLADLFENTLQKIKAQWQAQNTKRAEETKDILHLPDFTLKPDGPWIGTLATWQKEDQEYVDDEIRTVHAWIVDKINGATARMNQVATKAEVKAEDTKIGQGEEKGGQVGEKKVGHGEVQLGGKGGEKAQEFDQENAAYQDVLPGAKGDGKAQKVDGKEIGGQTKDDGGVGEKRTKKNKTQAKVTRPGGKAWRKGITKEQERVLAEDLANGASTDKSTSLVVANQDIVGKDVVNRAAPEKSTPLVPLVVAKQIYAEDRGLRSRTKPSATTTELAAPASKATAKPKAKPVAKGANASTQKEAVPKATQTTASRKRKAPPGDLI